MAVLLVDGVLFEVVETALVLVWLIWRTEVLIKNFKGLGMLHW